MRIIVRSLFLLLFVAVFAGCAASSAQKEDQGKVKVHCPACDTDFDALFHKRY